MRERIEKCQKSVSAFISGIFVFFEEIPLLKNIQNKISCNKALLRFLIPGTVQLLQNVEDDHFS